MKKNIALHLIALSLITLIAIFQIIPIPATAQEQTPIDVVMIFHECYGSDCMQAVAGISTVNFRNAMPEGVWTVYYQQILSDFDYKRLDFSVSGSKIMDTKATVIGNATISTDAGKAFQTETYHLIKVNGKWLIDDLVIMDEVVEDEIIGA